MASSVKTYRRLITLGPEGDRLYGLLKNKRVGIEAALVRLYKGKNRNDFFEDEVNGGGLAEEKNMVYDAGTQIDDTAPANVCATVSAMGENAKEEIKIEDKKW